MKRPAIDQLVYDYMFPKPRSTDPPNFQALLQRQLVPEVRLETQAFYGHLKSQEAKYPGLDYSYQPHRARLSRFQWHRRLFRAFDNLGLTSSEIASLTKWEGTRWAKERFEREQGIIIRDTTSDGISDWVEPELGLSAVAASTITSDDRQDSDRSEKARATSLTQEQVSERGGDQDEDHEDEREIEAPIDEDIDEESDLEIQSVGVALNERLRAVVAQREAGISSTVMDEEWEQWFKEAVEAGGLPLLSSDYPPYTSYLRLRQPVRSQSAIIPPRLISATRLDLRHRVPNLMHSIVRQNTDNSNSIINANDTYSRRIPDSFVSQRQFSPSPMNRGTTMSSQPYRSNTLSSPLRSYLSSAVEMNSRIRQWDNLRTSMRTSSSLRPSHRSSIQSTQNRPGSSGLSHPS